MSDRLPRALIGPTGTSPRFTGVVSSLKKTASVLLGSSEVGVLAWLAELPFHIVGPEVPVGKDDLRMSPAACSRRVLQLLVGVAHELVERNAAVRSNAQEPAQRPTPVLCRARVGRPVEVLRVEDKHNDASIPHLPVERLKESHDVLLEVVPYSLRGVVNGCLAIAFGGEAADYALSDNVGLMPLLLADVSHVDAEGMESLLGTNRCPLPS